MDAAMAGLGGIGAGHQVGQGRRPLAGAWPPAGFNDAAGNPPRQPLLAIGVDEISQLLFLQPVDQLSGRSPSALLHAHVQGTIEAEAEPRLGRSSWGLLTPRSASTPTRGSLGA